jgi:hypothetical protein
MIGGLVIVRRSLWVGAILTLVGCASTSGVARERSPSSVGQTLGVRALCHRTLTSPPTTVGAQPVTGASVPITPTSSGPAAHSIHILSGSDSCGHVWWASVDVSVSTSDAGSDGTEDEIADVTIVSGGDASYSLRPEDFEFVSRDGSIDKPLVPPPAGLGSALPTATLAAGEGVSGVVVFRVPAGGGQVIVTSAGESGRLTFPVSS